MSHQLIVRSPDLTRLRDEGFNIEISAGHLLVRDIPYVAADRSVRRGILICSLDLAGDVTTRPSTHVIRFSGDHPCHKDGKKITGIEHSADRVDIAPGVVADRQFSNKPAGGYANFYDKVTNYVTIISAPAEALDATATARTFAPVAADFDHSPFNYIDTASSRAGTTVASSKLTGQRLAIIGGGGTGSYVLDFAAKCPVAEIHLFDADRFSQHNAFRSPGAPSLDELSALPTKVDRLVSIYSRMHRGIRPHAVRIDSSNVSMLAGMDFVFVCIDRAADKAPIIAELENLGIPFVDVGMGLELDDQQALGGIVRVTASTPSMRTHVRDKGRVSIAEDAGDDDYRRNIQIAELNALNAALAVIKWKKLSGFYRDLGGEHFSAYAIDLNKIINEDIQCNPQ